MNYVSLMLCYGEHVAVFYVNSSNVIYLVSSECYLITRCLINQQSANCILPNLHSPINFYALSSPLSSFFSPYSFWSGRFLFGPPPFSSYCFFWCVCVWCAVCVCAWSDDSRPLPHTPLPCDGGVRGGGHQQRGFLSPCLPLPLPRG